MIQIAETFITIIDQVMCTLTLHNIHCYFRHHIMLLDYLILHVSLVES